MNRRPSREKKTQEGPTRQGTSPAARRQRGWLLIAAAVVGLVAGAVLLERLTRPSSVPQPTSRTIRGQSSAGGGRESVPRPPTPVRATTDELVAEGKQLAEELADAFPDSPEALALSGRVLFTLGSSAKAIDRWQEALRLSQASAEAWLGMAESAWEQGDFPRAIECMRRLAAVDPALAKEKTFILADSLLALGRAREAVDLLEEAGKSVPLPPWARVMLGQGYHELRDYERAAAQYRKVLQEHPQVSTAHYRLSLALMRLGRRQEAEKHRQEYARLKQKDMEAFDRKYHYRTQEERQSPAELSPILARFHVAAGRLYATRGQTERAERHWLRAWALAPDRPEPRLLVESLHRQ